MNLIFSELVISCGDLGSWYSTELKNRGILIGPGLLAYYSRFPQNPLGVGL